MAKKFDPYALKKPCANCPFLKDRSKAIDLQPGRVTGIINSLILDHASGFSCHKTTHRGDYVETDDGEEIYVPGGSELECAGAMAVLEKIGHRTQLMQVMGRLGVYDPDKYIPLFDLVIDYKAE
jgi:hypothetical protein